MVVGSQKKAGSCGGGQRMPAVPARQLLVASCDAVTRRFGFAQRAYHERLPWRRFDKEDGLWRWRTAASGGARLDPWR